MTENKRFYVAESNLIDGYCVFDREKKYAFTPRPRKADCLNDAHILNELSEENQKLKKENEQLKKEKEIVKEKLLEYILDYKKISNDNWNMGLSESVKTLQDEVKSLFENPFEWKYEYDCDDCKCFKRIEDNYDEAICSRYDKKISYYDTACEKFEWK